MNIFKGLFSGVKAVLGVGQDGSSNVMKVASGIGGWIDSQQFTEQEKSEFNKEMIKTYASYMENTVNENTQRSLTRREIAIWVIRTELIFLTSSIILFPIQPELSKYIYNIATTNPMAYLTLGVGAFFFGAHIVRQVKGS